MATADKPIDYRSLFDKATLGAWDLQGKDWTLTIRECRKVLLKSKEHPKGRNRPVVYFKELERGTDKGLVLNRTNGDLIAALYGPDVRAWAGKRITIYPTKVAFGRERVDAIRVRERAPNAATKAEAPPDVPQDEDMRSQQQAAAESADGSQPKPKTDEEIANAIDRGESPDA